MKRPTPSSHRSTTESTALGSIFSLKEASPCALIDVDYDPRVKRVPFDEDRVVGRILQALVDHAAIGAPIQVGVNWVDLDHGAPDPHVEVTIVCSNLLTTADDRLYPRAIPPTHLEIFSDDHTYVAQFYWPVPPEHYLQ
jgi:hypothetical protein